MTRAPENLLSVRSLLLTHLDNAPGPDDLDSAEVGIVGDPNHRGGYHCGSDRVDSDDYSVDESPRDRTGLTLDAAALDVGEFEVTVGGRSYDLPHFSAWCVGQCKAGAADTRDIREIIWSPDGRTVKRWDRLGRRSSGDDSHRWHTHFSFFRDAIKASRDQRPLFRRYLTTIGLLEDDDMTPEQAKQLTHVETMLSRLDGREPIGQAMLRIVRGYDDVTGAKPGTDANLNDLRKQLTALQTALAALAGKDFTDEPAIVQGVLAGLTPEKIADAIPDALTQQVADELAARMARSGPQ